MKVSKLKAMLEKIPDDYDIVIGYSQRDDNDDDWFEEINDFSIEGTGPYTPTKKSIRLGTFY